MGNLIFFIILPLVCSVGEILQSALQFVPLNCKFNCKIIVDMQLFTAVVA